MPARGPRPPRPLTESPSRPRPSVAHGLSRTCRALSESCESSSSAAPWPSAPTAVRERRADPGREVARGAPGSRGPGTPSATARRSSAAPVSGTAGNSFFSTASSAARWSPRMSRIRWDAWVPCFIARPQLTDPPASRSSAISPMALVRVPSSSLSTSRRAPARCGLSRSSGQSDSSRLTWWRATSISHRAVRTSVLVSTDAPAASRVKEAATASAPLAIRP